MVSLDRKVNLAALVLGGPKATLDCLDCQVERETPASPEPLDYQVAKVTKDYQARACQGPPEHQACQALTVYPDAQVAQDQRARMVYLVSLAARERGYDMVVPSGDV